MRGVKGMRQGLLVAAAVILVIFAGVRYFDYKTNQLMAKALPGVVTMLETESEPGSERAQEEAEGEALTESEGETLEGGEAPSPPENTPEGEVKASGAVKTQSPVQTKDSVEAVKADASEQTQTEAISVDPEAATLTEKAKAYKLASSKLTAGEINSLIKWSQGGFTQDEKEKAKALFYSRFTAEEQQWILGLFRKYGQ